MPSDTINMLTNLQTAEVSLVRRGANKKRFALTKSEGGEMSFGDVLKNVLETPAEGEDTLVQSLKAAGRDDESIEVARANFRLQNGFRDKLDPEDFGSIAKASGYEVPAKAAVPAEESVKKSHVPAEMPAELQAVWKAQQEEMELLRKANEEASSQIVAIRKEAQRKELVAKCAAEYAHVPGMSSEQMGEMLQKAYEVGEAFGRQLEANWAQTSEALKKSELLRPAGRSGHADSEASALGKLNSIAKQYVAKDAGLTKEKAFALALKKNPGLYEEYLAENPAQTGRRS